jgi:hypothetical protein
VIYADAANEEIDMFERLAGAAYGVTGLLSLSSQTRTFADARSFDNALAAWLLVTEAVTRNDDGEFVASWLRSQMLNLASGDSWLNMRLRTMFSESWVAGLPILLCPNPEYRDRAWCSFISWAGDDLKEVGAIRRIMYSLLTRREPDFFVWQHKHELPANLLQYESASAVAIVKVGTVLRKLEESASETDPTFSSILNEWRNILLAILKQVQSFERVKRGFAHQWPFFEDFVLAILHAATCLERPEIHQIKGMLSDLNSRPDESLNADQLVLAGYMVGNTLGYSRSAHWVQDRLQRGALSRQAAAQVANWSPNRISLPGGVDSTLFYSTISGSRSAFMMPCASPRSRTQTVRYEACSGAAAVSVSDDLLEVMLLDTFELTLAFREGAGADVTLPISNSSGGKMSQ